MLNSGKAVEHQGVRCLREGPNDFGEEEVMTLKSKVGESLPEVHR